MDAEISRWVLEFIIRKLPPDNQSLESIISALGVGEADPRLKKTLLLREIEADVSNRSITERTLESLEVIHEMDEKAASVVMKAAFCAVAVDCTVRFLEVETEKNGKYWETVKRVWRKRGRKMKSDGGMASEEVVKWDEEIEDAVWYPEVAEKILKRDTRGEALKRVGEYLKEAWAEMGPPLLEVAARRIVETGSVGIRDGVEREGVSGGKGKRKRVDRQAFAELIVILESSEENGGDGSSRRGLDELDVIEFDGGRKHCEDRDELDKDTSFIKRYHLPDTPYVDRVREGLKASSMVLLENVKDPLPEALRHADEVYAELNANSSMNVVTTVENPTGSEGQVHGSQIDTAADKAKQKEVAQVPGSQTDDDFVDKTNPEEINGQDPQGSKTNVAVQDNGVRNLNPVLSRWGVSGRSSTGPSTSCPNDPSSSNVSNSDAQEKIAGRRKRNLWSPFEEDILREGVSKYGQGNWKLIRYTYLAVFKDRTEVDLKDKWRNMNTCRKVV